MTKPRRSSLGVISLVTAGLMALVCGPVYAEPSPHYSDAPVVLPAPINYGRAPYAAEEAAIRRNDRSHQTYQRTSSASGGETEETTCRTQQVIYTTPVVRQVEPVVHTRVYYGPRRVRYVGPRPYYPYYPRKVYRHYRDGPRWGFRHHRPGPRYYRHHRPLYRPLRYLHHHRHHYPRGWGFSLGLGRGYHGHRSGGFSLYLNR